ncbi:MAG: cytochrome c oxidase subunit 3 [Porticoccaceae bacterium]|nr:cytochrome c oxidase subunit 3 [Porticoccaceae bacterium]|tara:strand:- start:796 stop:1749 length:954 start_codon:yes stop_codon:yes gene_type:complete
MAEQGNYYVPEQSKLPLLAALGMGTMGFGAATWVIDGQSATVFVVGLAILAIVMYKWWSVVIEENMRGMVSDQLKHSYVLGMLWFIFSEVMFFAAFFGALFYVRVLVNPWIGGEAAITLFDDTPTDASVANSELLYPGYESTWPPLITPDQAANGESAKFVGPDQAMSFPGFSNWQRILAWLPLWNTIILLTSSYTVNIAHHALKEGNRKIFIRWLGITVFLGGVFLVLQAEEYIEAYQHMGLTLDSGIYGTTFFLLTGFHGAHVTLGTIMLLVSFLRGLKGHFKNDDHFGFEAAAWYWHFVDVVWVGLFLVVYVFD